VVPGAVGHNNPEDHSGLRKKAADKKAGNAADGCDGHHILAHSSKPYSRRQLLANAAIAASRVAA